MPEGYKCEMCGDFSTFTHNMTEVNIGKCVAEDYTTLAPTYTLCPSCATDIREIIQDVVVPDDAKEEL